MSIRHELHYPHAIASREHEAVLNVIITGAMLDKEGDAIFRPHGLTQAQFNVLMLLRYQAPAEGLAQTVLGDMMLVHRSNITGIVDRMEAGGLVVRGDDGGDRRRKLVTLTRAGRDVLEKVTFTYMKRIERAMNGVTPRDQAALCRVLETVRRNLRGD